jgi:hypothetical protein
MRLTPTNSEERLRPKWSLATSFWFCLGVTAIVVTVICLTVRKSIWVELEMVTGVLAALMFGYFSILLHLGVRFNDSRRAIIDWPISSPSVFVDSIWLEPGIGFFSALGAEAGCLGIIIGYLLDVVVMIALVFLIAWLFWLGENVVLAVIPFLYWVHRRWLRYLVTRGRHCRGNWAKSLLHGGTTTVLYSFWFYTILMAAQKVSEFMRK